MSGFLKGFITGAAVVFALAVMVGACLYRYEKGKELLKAKELQFEVLEMREDVLHRGTDDLLDMPGVRGAAEGARDKFHRRLDEVLQRHRGSGDSGGIDAGNGNGD
jgi:hypothetical protein